MANLKYANINAKLKGMNKKNLDREELENLIKQNNMKSAICILKQEFEPLRNIIEDIDRINLEQELDKILINDIIKISKYLSDDEKRIFYLYISKYEIKCINLTIKNMIKKINRKKENITIWTKNIFKNIENIEASQNEEELMKTLKKSNYYKTIENYINKVGKIENISISEFEIKLDNIYFEKLYKEASSYNEVMKKLIGEKIDLLNIISIYRLKKYYSKEKDNIKSKLIPEKYRLNEEKIEELINSNNYEEFKNYLLKTPYKSIIENANEESLERNINIYLYKQYKKIFIKSPYNIATVISYIALSEYQKHNIINIVGGITYNLTRKEIADKIIIY